MIKYDEIKKSFSDISNLGNHARNIIKEALQYKALEIIYNGKFAKELVFIGGTNLRILHGIKRFSEDIDFDILSEKYDNSSHKELMENLCKGFKAEGYNVDYKIKPAKYKTLTGRLVFPGLEYALGASKDPRTVLHIKVDAQAQGYNYKPDYSFINKFGVYTHVNSMPVNHIFASKLITATQRVKGRDLYDIVELSSFARVNQEFLNHLFSSRNIKVSCNQDIKNLILDNLKNTDWEEKENEISQFVFDKKDINKVVNFREWFSQLDIESIID